MISATSSLASGILSGTFGKASTATPSLPSASTASAPTQASIVAALLPTSSESSLLSNIAFAQDTEFLLNDPHSNGAISGTPSNYVQQIISKLAPGAPTATASNSTAGSTTSTTTPAASSLPSEGILA